MKSVTIKCNDYDSNSEEKRRVERSQEADELKQMDLKRRFFFLDYLQTV